ncbi:hypothetical protein Acy02nite_72830 [Actinoplanes cyaneus]|uniref:MmpS family membrane protein n=2 Tax=Actinoplanes cyaneus TaxID=52696 RepID=A0A919IQD5_9ACTN|nr:hypothetical protein Acy02nite_72830 [Actinoplanes cyaneus]
MQPDMPPEQHPQQPGGQFPPPGAGIPPYQPGGQFPPPGAGFPPGQPGGQFPPQQPYFPGQYPPPAPPKKSRKTLWIILGIIGGLVVLCCGGGFAIFGKAASDVTKESKTDHTVRYEVTGGDAADITYTTANFGTEQAGGAALPWTKEVTVTGWNVVSLIAQDKGSGSVGCKIYIDGALKVEQKSTGDFAVVTCTASNL